MKLRLTLICDYEINPKHYGTDDSKEIVKIDQQNAEEDPFIILNNTDYTVKIEEIK